MDNQKDEEHELKKKEISYMLSFGLVQTYHLSNTKIVSHGRTQLQLREYKLTPSEAAADDEKKQTKSKFIHNLPLYLIYEKRGFFRHPKGGSLLHQANKRSKKEADEPRQFIGSNYEKYCSQPIVAQQQHFKKEEIKKPVKRVFDNILNMEKKGKKQIRDSQIVKEIHLNSIKKVDQVSTKPCSVLLRTLPIENYKLSKQTKDFVKSRLSKPGEEANECLSMSENSVMMSPESSTGEMDVELKETSANEMFRIFDKFSSIYEKQSETHCSFQTPKLDLFNGVLYSRLVIGQSD